MKRILFTTIVFFTLSLCLPAQNPPPPPSHGSKGGPVGGGAPIGGGLFIMLALGSAYAGKKYIDYRRENR